MLKQFLRLMQLAAGNCDQSVNEKRNQSFHKRDGARGNSNCTGFSCSKVSACELFQRQRLFHSIYYQKILVFSFFSSSAFTISRSQSRWCDSIFFLLSSGALKLCAFFSVWMKSDWGQLANPLDSACLLAARLVSRLRLLMVNCLRSVRRDQEFRCLAE